MSPKAGQNWWRGAVMYQVYPRSFCDTTGNGVGDLNGITEKLDYIASLGVEAIWISPFFKSPMKDFGYDVSDYLSVDPIFGTNEDFDALLKRAHDLDLKIIIDLVLSHTSDQHPWFSDPAKKDWYVWADPKTDDAGNRVPPNNWVSCFGGSAWEYSETYEQYYLHNFLKEQPDLNFHNPAVRANMLDIAKYWLERGVDGFRLDVVNFFFHDEQLRDNPPRPDDMGFALQFESKDDPYSQQQHIHDKSQPENLDFLRDFRALLNEYNAFSIGEIGDDAPHARAREYTAEGLLHTAYNTDMMAGTHKAPTASMIRAAVESYGTDRNPSWAFSNHDVVRAGSRWHESGDGFTQDPRLSKMLMTLLTCLRGTSFIYQGEELGLPEARIPFESLQDPWAKETWPKWQGRDGCRTPMVWDRNKLNRGFSSANTTWLPIPESHNALCAAQQDEDQASTLNTMRKFLTWRTAQSALCDGNIMFEDLGNEKMLCFTRQDDTQHLRCAFNLSDTKQAYQPKGEIIFGDNHKDTLEPYGLSISAL